LDLFLNAQIKNSYKIANVTLLLIDLTRPLDEEDRQVISVINEYQIKQVILVLTKADLSSERKINEYKNQVTKLISPCEIIAISSKKSTGLAELLSMLAKHLPIADLDLIHHENDNFTISETIREQIIFNTKQELPYATSVYVELNQYDKLTNTLNIQAVIVVEKESQKPIVIGKNGSMIKKIGIMSRKELLQIYDSKINLKLFVKVQKE
jgi:GTP-binding protein Era